MLSPKLFEGQPVAPGISVAPAIILKHEMKAVPVRKITQGKCSEQIELLDQAIAKTRQDITKQRSRAMSDFGDIVARIFDAHLLILEDEPTFDQIREAIRVDCITAEYALWQTLEAIARSLAAQKEDLFRDRAQDVRDICRRIINHLAGKATDKTIGVNQSSVLIAQQLNPSDILLLDTDLIVGVATDAGGATSHTAILTRILGVPSVVGLKNIVKNTHEGDIVVVNGNSGKVLLRPLKNDLKRYEKKHIQYQNFLESLKDVHSLPAETTDGHSIDLVANIELPQEARKINEKGGQGVGLFRSEYLFLARGGMPDENEQYEQYLKVVETLPDKPVTIRTFDLGGDKAFPGYNLPAEANPFLGWRAIRVGLDTPELLLTQLRAILRASKKGHIKIMFPMISDLNELFQAKRLLEQAKEELDQENQEYDKNIEVGIMVEIPAVAVMADRFARHVDFFSIGTNDLVQFCLAVDRGNEQVAHLYQPYHPGVLDLIQFTINKAHENNIKVGICGELAGDPLATLLLLGMGVDQLSISPAMIPEIKKLIRSSTFEEAIQVTEEIRKCETATEARSRLHQIMRKRFADMPIWFGPKS